MKLFMLLAALSPFVYSQTTSVAGGRTMGPLNYCQESSGAGNAYVFELSRRDVLVIATWVAGNLQSFACQQWSADDFRRRYWTNSNKKGGAVDLAAGDIQNGQMVMLEYDGTVWQASIASAGAASAGPNPALSKFFAALGASGDIAQNVLILGDSESRCWGNVCGNYGPTYQNSLWVEKLKAYLSLRFGSHGPGILALQPGPGGIDGHFYSTTGTFTTIPDIGPYNPSYGTVDRFSQNATITLIPQFCDRFRIYYATSTDTGTGFAVSIDGGSPQTVGNQTSSTAIARTVEVAAGNLGNHVVTLTKAGTGYMHIYGVEPLIGTSGVSVQNVSLAGCTADCWADNNSSRAAEAFNDVIPGSVRLVFIVLGANEINSGTPVSTYTANYQKIIDHFKAYSPAPNLILMTEPWIQSNLSSAPAYNSAVLQLGANNSLPVFDAATDYFISYANEQSNGWIQADGTHLNDNAQQGWAAYILPKIFGTGEGIANAPTGSSGGVFNGGSITNPLQITLTNGQTGYAETITQPIATDYAHYAVQNDSNKVFSFGIGGSSSVQPNRFFLYNPNTGSFPIAIDQSDNIFMNGGVQIKPTNPANGAGLNLVSGDNTSGYSFTVSNSSGPFTFYNLKTSTAPFVIDRSAPENQFHLQNDRVSTNQQMDIGSSGLNQYGFCAFLETLPLGILEAAQSGSNAPGHFILNKAGGGRYMDFFPDGTLKLSAYAAPSGQKYFLCIDSNGVINSQSTACQ